MKLYFLGTGAGMPSKERNVSALVLDLLQELNSMWLFDCGEATQHQILRTTIKPRKINKIFISHLHGDHIFGLPGFLSSRSFQGGNTPLTVYGPVGLKAFIDSSLTMSDTHLKYDLVIKELSQGIIFENEKFIVECISLDHNIRSYGFKIVEKDKLGELNVAKLKSEGIMPGPIYRHIKENEQTVLDDGRTIRRNDYIGESKQGKIITIFGDTRFNEKFIPFIKDSHVLVHEATFNASNEKLAYDYYHSTTKQAALLAKKAQVETLIMTHISSRYQLNDMTQLEKEARDIFSNSYVAYDFFSHDI